MAVQQIDINCDMGESFGNFKMGNDEAIFPYITSSNIACGFHAGDPLHMQRTIQLAIAHEVQIGAHPGYPDLAGFGRRKMNFQKGELKAIIKYQIAAIKGVTESLGAQLKYVKPHGALYNTMVNSELESLEVVKAIREIDENLALMCLAGSLTEEIAKANALRFIAEAFADRRYEADGKLMSRSKAGAVIHNANLAASQVIAIVKNNTITTANGNEITINAQSVCIHGDNKSAVEILQAIDRLLLENNIVKKHF